MMPHKSWLLIFTILTYTAPYLIYINFLLFNVSMFFFTVIEKSKINGLWYLAISAGLAIAPFFFKKVRIRIREVTTWLYSIAKSNLTEAPNTFWAGFFEISENKIHIEIWNILIIIIPFSLFILLYLNSPYETSQKKSAYYSATASLALISLFIIANSIILRKIKTKKKLKLQEIKYTAPAEKFIKIAHFSDLHIPHECKLTEEGAWDRTALDRLANKIDTLKENGVTALVFSGDITDTGHEAAWKIFKSTFSRHAENIVLAPGNHDLNIVGYGGIASLFAVGDYPNQSGRYDRIKNFMDASVEIMKERVEIVQNGKFIKLENSWNEIKNLPKVSPRIKLSMALNLFPLYVTTKINTGETVQFVIWNSVRSSCSAIYNSFGEINTKQIEKHMEAKKIREIKNRYSSFVHVMHHKLAFPSAIFEKISNSKAFSKIRVQTAGMVVRNPTAMLDMLLNEQPSSVVLHGHHHASFIGELIHPTTAHKVQVLSAPSTTLGAEFAEPSWEGLGFDLVDVNLATTGSEITVRPTRTAY